MATRLPRQIQEQVDAADALMQAALTPPGEPQPPQPTDPTPPPSLEVPQPQPTPPVPPASAAPAPDPWEHKYRVLQGMFNQQNSQFKELSNKFNELNARLTQAPSPAPAPTTPAKPSADPKDVESFGLDLVTMVQRVTEQYLSALAPTLDAKFSEMQNAIAQLQQAVQGTTQTVAATAEDVFFRTLTEIAPEWQKLNTDQAFLAWLNEVDPMYGVTRDFALKDAQQRNDARRAAEVFKAFSRTLPPPPAAPPVSPTPRSAGAPVPAGTPQKPVFRQAEVVAFYDDVRRGRYRGNITEQQRLEQQFDAAMAEGRIV